MVPIFLDYLVYVVFLHLCAVAADMLNAARDDVEDYLPYG